MNSKVDGLPHERRGLLSRIGSDLSSIDGYDDHDQYVQLQSLPSMFHQLARDSKDRLFKSHRRRTISRSPSHRSRKRRRLFRTPFNGLLAFILHAILILILIFGFFFPSYTYPPPRFTELRNRVRTSNSTGSANPNNERVFIAASLYDAQGELISGHWGRSVLKLVDILGPSNVFVSIFEDDFDTGSAQALHDFGQALTCESSLVVQHLHMSEIPRFMHPDGSERFNRIALLAQVRNRALRPLEDEKSAAYNTRWDKVLYLNDVAFDPIDAANLLFNTNVDEATGKADYRAACAVDFINPFKFYDTYATRDLEGYQIGLPFYPWFSSAGTGTSRRDVLSQTDAVRVKSCWGGMIALEGKWLQPNLYEVRDGDLVIPLSDVGNSTAILPSVRACPSPLRFRYEHDMFWDASECCLLNADLAHMAAEVSGHSTGNSGSTGIYINPYIRVAYSPKVLPWLHVTRRLERLYPIIHAILNKLASMPARNPKRLQQPGTEVRDMVWTNSGGPYSAQGGSFHPVHRVAQPGGFCGLRQLSSVRIGYEQSNMRGMRWYTEKSPPVDDYTHDW